MSILSAQSIMAARPISPIRTAGKIRGRSYGLSHAGYDVCIAEDFVMWPQRFVLASTQERFHMPNNVAARVHDKSTWARLGITVQNTFIEPGWHGYLTLEITNHCWRFRKLRAGDPIAQIVFEWLDEPTKFPYDGKYQNQPAGPQPAILEG